MAARHNTYYQKNNEILKVKRNIRHNRRKGNKEKLEKWENRLAMLENGLKLVEPPKLFEEKDLSPKPKTPARRPIKNDEQIPNHSINKDFKMNNYPQPLTMVPPVKANDEHKIEAPKKDEQKLKEQSIRLDFEFSKLKKTQYKNRYISIFYAGLASALIVLLSALSLDSVSESQGSNIWLSFFTVIGTEIGLIGLGAFGLSLIHQERFGRGWTLTILSAIIGLSFSLHSVSKQMHSSEKLADVSSITDQQIANELSISQSSSKTLQKYEGSTSVKNVLTPNKKDLRDSSARLEKLKNEKLNSSNKIDMSTKAGQFVMMLNIAGRLALYGFLLVIVHLLLKMFSNVIPECNRKLENIELQRNLINI